MNLQCIQVPGHLLQNVNYIVCIFPKQLDSKTGSEQIHGAEGSWVLVEICCQIVFVRHLPKAAALG